MDRITGGEEAVTERPGALQPPALDVWDDVLAGSPAVSVVPTLALMTSDEPPIDSPIESPSMNMERDMPVASKARSITYSAAMAPR